MPNLPLSCVSHFSSLPCQAEASVSSFGAGHSSSASTAARAKPVSTSGGVDADLFQERFAIVKLDPRRRLFQIGAAEEQEQPQKTRKTENEIPLPRPPRPQVLAITDKSSSSGETQAGQTKKASSKESKRLHHELAPFITLTPEDQGEFIEALLQEEMDSLHPRKPSKRRLTQNVLTLPRTLRL